MVLKERQMHVTELQPRIESPEASGWIDVSRVACGYGMPGKVRLAPSVWLCCVYFAARDEDRIDPRREAFRLDALLRDAATAWSQHTRTVGSRAGQCIFRFNPGRPLDDNDSGPVSFNLAVTVRADDKTGWATQIELDN